MLNRHEKGDWKMWKIEIKRIRVVTGNSTKGWVIQREIDLNVA